MCVGGGVSAPQLHLGLSYELDHYYGRHLSSVLPRLCAGLRMKRTSSSTRFQALELQTRRRLSSLVPRTEMPPGRRLSQAGPGATPDGQGRGQLASAVGVRFRGLMVSISAASLHSLMRGWWTPFVETLVVVLGWLLVRS